MILSSTFSTQLCIRSVKAKAFSESTDSFAMLASMRSKRAADVLSAWWATMWLIVVIVVIVMRIIGNSKRDHRLKEGTRFIRGIAVIHRYLFKPRVPIHPLLACLNKPLMTKDSHSSFGETLPTWWLH